MSRYDVFKNFLKILENHNKNSEQIGKASNNTVKTQIKPMPKDTFIKSKDNK